MTADGIAVWMARRFGVKNRLRSGEVREAFRCWGISDDKKYFLKLVREGVLNQLPKLVTGERACYSREQVEEIISRVSGAQRPVISSHAERAIR